MKTDEKICPWCKGACVILHAPSGEYRECEECQGFGVLKNQQTKQEISK